MEYIITAGLGLVYAVLILALLILALYDEIIEEDSDIHEQDFVYMEDGTAVKYDEDNQE